MNAFEALIAALIEREGYWVRSSFKVTLTRTEKVRIGRHSSPRWEIDLVAYSAVANELRLIECKSYLDSPGVRARDFNNEERFAAKRYKLFNEPTLRRIVINRAVRQLTKAGLCLPSPKTVLCLAAGNIRSEADELQIRTLFDQEGWTLYSRSWITKRLRTVAEDGYENSIGSIVAKLLHVDK
jgi:hypothetical protein